MNQNLIKTGSCSIILGPGHFAKYLPFKDQKLLKIGKVIPNHNEFKNLSIVRQIENYKDYYTIPDEQIILIEPGKVFYEHIKKLVTYEECNILGGILSCYYIDYAGDKELLETIGDIEVNQEYSIWKSYIHILKFSKQIMTGLKFLHEKKLSHLDIKPENIMVNSPKFKFKIIDFGFCSQEPFQDFVTEVRGTPGYFPRNFEIIKDEPWLPRIVANDFIKVNGKIPIQIDYLQVYKIDSFCFGRVLNFLKYMYDEYKLYSCCNNEINKGKKIDLLINDLTFPDCWSRKTITECLEIHFKV